MDLKEKPLVSVAMVTYNSAKYVEAAIRSVLGSSYENFELIIADDCSTDNTWEIIGSFEDKRIRAIRNKTNLREYKNRNQCIALAKGKYFIFIDGDDLIYEHGLETYVFYAEKHQEARMIIQKNYRNNIVFPIKLNPKEVLNIEFFGKGLLSSSFCSNFFQTKVLKTFPLREDFIAGDDYIRLKIACAFPVLFIAGWLSWPRETPGQASGKLENGIGLAESLKVFKELRKEKAFPLTNELLDEVEKKKKYYLFKIIVKNVLRGKVQHVRMLQTISNTSLKGLMKPYNHKVLASFDDEFSPEKPLTQLV